MAYSMFGARTMIVSALLACACGGTAETSNPGGAPKSALTCPAVTPCGGDIVGVWAIKQECIVLGANAISALCAGATIGVSDLTATGTISFNADNTLTSSGNLSFTETVNFPTTCLTSDQCVAYGSALSAQPGVTNPHCTYDTGAGCSCSLDGSQATMSSGSYQVEGSTLTITSATSAQPEVDSYCVSGDTLSIFQESNGTTATLILTK